ncbi:MAG: M4 family metallopeptidase [Phycisphaerales bacterium]|nr:MAG: M4 family metallopeptidase [Phycisphaerales bacterium]
MRRTSAVSAARNSWIGFGYVLIIATGAIAAPQAGQTPANDMIIHRSKATGLATFLIAGDSGRIPTSLPPGLTAAQPIDLVHEYGHLFGINDPNQDLIEIERFTGRLGQTHTTYRQVYVGVPVFAGELKIHQDAGGDFAAANGAFHPIPAQLDTTPTLTTTAAAAIAQAKVPTDSPKVEHNELVIVDPSWYGDPFIGPHLAYYLIVSDPAAPLREAFFIDAHSGTVLDQWTLAQTIKYRMIYSARNSSVTPGWLYREEGQPPWPPYPEINNAYDYSGDFYDFFYRMFQREGIDDGLAVEPLLMMATVYFGSLMDPDPWCPNAMWNGVRTVYCNGTAYDDIIGHEWGHALTDYSAQLVYQNQSGQLNEHYSDVWGELIDLFNGNVSEPGDPDPTDPQWPKPFDCVGSGLDLPNNLRTPGLCSYPLSYIDGMRWLLGEDSTASYGFGGPIRDMWEPTCYTQPDYANHEYQTCGGPTGQDNGGVHQGCGIPNHAFAMVVDGKSFRGYDVTGIGAIKAAAVWYRALTVYLINAADFKIAYYALNLAARDLIGTTPRDPRTGLPSDSEFTAFDAQQVDMALRAVEMDTNGRCGSNADVLSSIPPEQCYPRRTILSDRFENGVGAWTQESSPPSAPYEWVQRGDLPLDREGTAWFIADPKDCDDTDVPARTSLISPAITIPADLSDLNEPKLAFTHFVGTEPVQDGGNLKIIVDGSAWQLIPNEAFEYNSYNSLLDLSGAANPLRGEPGWSGVSTTWGTSVVDLSAFVNGSETIQIRFDFGRDCRGFDGWYVDDFKVYVCSCDADAFCDDGLFCTGRETCVDGLCRLTDNPCAGAYCDEINELCLATLFWDDFEDGNSRGWELGTADDTATQGQWEIGDPIGTNTSSAGPAQPEEPYAGLGCAFTGQNPGGSFGIGDVDGGITYLVSPTIDLSGRDNAELRFARWFFERELTGNDFYKAEASDDDGNTWVLLEMVGPAERANQWTPVSFQLEDFIDLTATVRLRFAAQDDAALSDTVEAAIDELFITADDLCFPLNGDADGNCTVDLADHVQLSGCLTGPQGGPYPQECAPFNFDPDTDVDLRDLAAFQRVFTGR